MSEIVIGSEYSASEVNADRVRYNRERREMSALVHDQFAKGDTVHVTYKKKQYTGKIVRLNKVTANVELALTGGHVSVHKFNLPELFAMQNKGTVEGFRLPEKPITNFSVKR